MIDVAAFRALFPAFADLEKFPDLSVAWHLESALEECGPRWGAKRERGAMLLAAHTLTLWGAAGKAADGTGGIDVAAGPTVSESKAVGSVSKSVSKAGPGSLTTADAGSFAATIWGVMYYDLRRTLGIGGVVV